MWPKFINSKFFTILLTAFVSILCVLLTQSLTTKREDKLEIKNELKQKASVHYVDQQDEILRKEFQDADRAYREYMTKSVDEINNNVREVRNYIMSHPK